FSTMGSSQRSRRRGQRMPFTIALGRTPHHARRFRAGRKSSEPAAVSRGLAAWGDPPRSHSGAGLFPLSFPTGAPPGVFFSMVGPGVSLTEGFLSLASLQPQTPRRPTHTSRAGTVSSNRRMLTGESPQTTSRQIDDVAILVAGDVEPGGEIDPREDR